MIKSSLSHSQNNSQPKSNLKLISSYTLHEDDVLVCKQYKIPYQKSYSTQKELAATEELIGDYLDLLEDAKSLGIAWDTSTAASILKAYVRLSGTTMQESTTIVKIARNFLLTTTMK